MTRSGIEYNLRASPYRMTVGGVTFHFSSEGNMGRFARRYEESAKLLNNFLTTKFSLAITPTALASFRAYIKVEKRGFYAVWRNVELTSPEQVALEITPLPNKSKQK